MTEINLNHLIRTLIKNYEKVHGRRSFEVSKIENTFIYTKVNQRMLNTIKLKRRDVVGMECTVLPIRIDLSEKLPAIFEKAWNGKEMLYFFVPYTNENVCLVVALNPVIKNGKTIKLEGVCAPLEVKELEGKNLI